MDRSWVVYCCVGELVGFATAASFNLLHMFLIGDPSTWSQVLIILILAGFGGLAEGGILAWFQYQQLSKYLPDVPRRRFVKYTAMVASLGWVLGMFFPTVQGFQGQSSQVQEVAEPSILIISLMGLFMGLGLGLVFGLIQSIPLRSHAKKTRYWILTNMVGWGLAMVVLMVGPSSIPVGVSIVFIIGVAMVCGLLAGAVIGISTSFSLPTLMVDGG